MVKDETVLPSGVSEKICIVFSFAPDDIVRPCQNDK